MSGNAVNIVSVVVYISCRSRVKKIASNPKQKNISSKFVYNSRSERLRFDDFLQISWHDESWRKIPSKFTVCFKNSEFVSVWRIFSFADFSSWRQEKSRQILENSPKFVYNSEVPSIWRIFFNCWITSPDMKNSRGKSRQWRSRRSLFTSLKLVQFDDFLT